MNDNQNLIEDDEFEILTTEGQILLILMNKSLIAGDICKIVRASNSTISRKLARMVDQGIIECRISPNDRRKFCYSISENYRIKFQNKKIIQIVSEFSTKK
jgi:DNA-binding MarR family transcriptional regulator